MAEVKRYTLCTTQLWGPSYRLQRVVNWISWRGQLWESTGALGSKQSKLGSKQNKLGSKQSKLGSKQSRQLKFAWNDKNHPVLSWSVVTKQMNKKWRHMKRTSKARRLGCCWSTRNQCRELILNLTSSETSKLDFFRIITNKAGSPKTWESKQKVRRKMSLEIWKGIFSHSNVSRL